jgi:uncharacterized protein
MSVLTPFTDSAETETVVSATRLWLERAVIGLNLCPFAKAAYAKHHIRFAVTAARNAGEVTVELRHELALLVHADPDALETTLLIHPQALTDFIEYHLFLKSADATVRSLGHEGVVQIASFHPTYAFAGSAHDDIENFTNRSPYPMLHLLREASVERAVAAFPDTAAIYERNIATLRRLGHVGWRKLWSDDESRP